MTKSAGNCGFGHIYLKCPSWGTSFSVQYNVHKHSNFEGNLRNRYSLKSHEDNEFDDINAKIMDLKALFMDETYTL